MSGSPVTELAKFVDYCKQALTTDVAWRQRLYHRLASCSIVFIGRNRRSGWSGNGMKLYRE